MGKDGQHRIARLKQNCRSAFSDEKAPGFWRAIWVATKKSSGVSCTPAQPLAGNLTYAEPYDPKPIRFTQASRIMRGSARSL